MSALERLTAAAVLVLILLLGGAWWVHHYGAEQYEAGRTAAIDAGKEQHDRDAADARKTESDLRAQLRGKDADALKKKEEYAANLDDAQRRVRAGTDRLHCPVSPVPAGATPGDRPASGGSGAGPEGPDIVPETAAEILGDGADVAGLVRRYERVVERFEDCRAVNAR